MHRSVGVQRERVHVYSHASPAWSGCGSGVITLVGGFGPAFRPWHSVHRRPRHVLRGGCLLLIELRGFRDGLHGDVAGLGTDEETEDEDEDEGRRERTGAI